MRYLQTKKYDHQIAQADKNLEKFVIVDSLRIN